MNKEILFAKRIFNNIFHPLIHKTTKENYDSIVIYVCKNFPFDYNDDKIKYTYYPYFDNTPEYSYKTLDNITNNKLNETIKVLILLYDFKDKIAFDLENEINKCIEYSIKLDWFNPGIYFEKWNIIRDINEINKKVMCNNTKIALSKYKNVKKIWDIIKNDDWNFIYKLTYLENKVVDIIIKMSEKWGISRNNIISQTQQTSKALNQLLKWLRNKFKNIWLDKNIIISFNRRENVYICKLL